MTQPSLVLGVCAIFLCSTSVMAEEPERLADLSKSDFLAEYEDHFLESLALSAELLRRFDPAYADMIDVDTPVTEAERAAFECMYDTMAEQDALAQMAEQSLASETLVARIETDTDFDYVDMMDPALKQEVIGLTPSDAMITAMASCGSMTLSAERMSFSGGFWAELQAAATERGYVGTE